MSSPVSNSFMLSSASVMIAPAFTTPVTDLQPALHGVGMVGDVQFKVDSSMIELKNGVAQAVVDSRRSNVVASITATLYEFTSANILRASAIASGTTPQVKHGVLTADVAGSAASLTVASAPVPGDANSGITAIGDIPAGSTILISHGTIQDYVFPTMTSGAATGNGAGPFTLPIAAPYAIPANMSFPAGSEVWILTPVPVGNVFQDDLFGVKVTGTLANYNRPMTAIFPKVRISKGFQINYTPTSYGSMPFEMSPLLMTANEASVGRLVEIGTTAPGRLYPAA